MSDLARKTDEITWEISPEAQNGLVELLVYGKRGITDYFTTKSKQTAIGLSVKMFCFALKTVQNDRNLTDE